MASPDGLALLESHLTGCERCRRELDRIFGECQPDGRVPEDLLNSENSRELRRVIHESKSLRLENRQSAPDESRPPQQSGDARPERIGDYAILRQLGQGGMGRVYEAYDNKLDRKVAIKTVLPHLLAEPEKLVRFLAEARTAARIHHPHVVCVHSVEDSAEGPYLVQQLVAGESLETVLSREPLSMEQTLRLAKDVASGLAAAHRQGIVHRDIKPANILLAEVDGRAVVSDFGLARSIDDPRLTASGFIAGTPEYLSPEQAQGRAIDARADLFSLGAVLYAAVSGASPFRADNAWASVHRVCDYTPPLLHKAHPHVPEWFAQLVARLMEKDPNLRPQSAQAVIEVLAEADDTSRIDGATITESRRRRVGPYVAAGVLSIGMLCWGVALWIQRDSRPQLSSAEQRDPNVPRITQSLSVPAISILGRTIRTETLSAAIAEADDGDTIEIKMHGRVVCQPVDMGQKALTIRASKGVKPVLIHDPSSIADQPLFSTKADLVLDGISIEWEVANGETFELFPFDHSVISSHGDSLTLSDCNIRSGPYTNCCASGAGRTIIEGCELVSHLGKSVCWSASPDSKLMMADSFCSAFASLSISTEGNSDASSDRVLVLSHVHLQGEDALELFPQSASRLIAIESDHSVFEVNNLCDLRGRAIGSPLRMSPEQRFRQLILWRKDERNAYAASLQFVTRRLLRRNVFNSGLADTLDDWQALWGLADGRSFSFTDVSELPADVGTVSLSLPDQNSP